ncbi:MAG: tRNA (N(6)-L-threonylcarbamoyladenosine(37)-C(2))-methylthiotransferase MtaB [Moorellales bacterium]
MSGPERGQEERPRIAFATLGCKVNQSEVEAFREMFRRQGYRVVPFEQEADVYLIHTCTVTHLSDRKCRQVIRRAVRQNPAATVVVTGCYAQVAPEEVAAIPGVRVVVGAKGRQGLVEAVEKARAGREPLCLVRPWEEGESFEELPVGGAERTRALVRVQEGCDNACTYCLVPQARGPARSRPPEAARAEVERLVRSGFREIVLTGVNLGAYGRDLGTCLADLLRDLVRVPGLGRLRLSSVEPQHFDPELVAVVTGEEKICPHWHIPLQSGDAATLRRMGRTYTPEEYAALVERLRQGRPEGAVTTDVIVGFPGEDEAAFVRTLAFVEAVGFSRLHVFAYSPRRGTAAAELPGQVSAAVKAERSRRLRALGERLARAYAERFVGRELQVLVERPAKSRPTEVEGHSENYLLVRLPGGQECLGHLIPVRICCRRGEELEGEPVRQKLAGGVEPG